MKLFLVVFLLLCANISVFSQQSKVPSFIEREKQYFGRLKSAALTPHHDYNIIYQRMYWAVDPAKRYIAGSVTSYFNTLSSDFNTIYFDLHRNLNVDSILYHGEKITFSHADHVIQISLPSTLNKYTLDSVCVFYQGIPPTSANGFGAFETSQHDGTPVLWTLSEPYGAKEWWPCKQSLTDKIDSVDIYIEMPSSYKAASNGKLISEQIVGSKKIAHWKHRHPIATYLVAIAVTNYSSFSYYAKVDSVNTVEILNYVYPEDQSWAQPAIEYTVDVLELYSQLFIPYPFYNEKYGHAQFGWGGGMEHQTMSFMGSFSQMLISHELSHQWFGDYVTCSSWQDIWVNEGFAVFCESVVQENLHPENYLQWKKDRMKLVLDNASTGSVFVADSSNVDRIFNYYLTYQKGGLIIHQLRNQIGDDAFFTGLKNLLTNAETRGKFASAQTIKSLWEEAADTNLTTYFNDWYYGMGYPRYNIGWMQDVNFDVSIYINQTTTDASVPFFAMKVPILLKGDEQEELVVFKNSENKQSFRYNPGFAVNSIEFDPEYTIIAPHPANISLNIPDALYNDLVLVAPNPANEQLLIKSNFGGKIKSVFILNSSGKHIYRKTYSQEAKKLSIDIQNYKSGLYFIQVETDLGSSINKIFIHH